MITDRLLSWLLTYAVHSTFFLGLAGLIAGRLARKAPGAAEAVWRFALVAGLVTATLAPFNPWSPAAGTWSLAARPAQAAALEALSPVPAADPAPAPVWRSARELPAPSATAGAARSGEGPAPASGIAWSLPAPASRPVPAARSLRGAALSFWLLGAALLSLGAARSYLRLRNRLQRRPRIVAGDLHAKLTQLAAGADLGAVRLTCSSRVPVPLALGVARREICVPPRALAGLSREQQEGMLAHELAHLARRDPSWLLATHLLTCLFFFQPLNWLARRRLRELSELLADEWAVGRTGRPLSLAGCLAEVAGWAFGQPRLPVAAMADRPSNLARRITRLLDGGEGSSRVRRLVLGSGLVLALIAVLGVAPVVRSAETEGGTPAAKARAAAERSAAAGASEAASEAVAEDQAREEAGEEGAACDRDHDHGRVHAAMMADSIHASIEEAVHHAVREARAVGGHRDGHGEDAEEVEEAVNDAVDDAVESAVEGAVEGAMAGIEASLDSLDGVSDAFDDLDDALDVDIDQDLEREIERSTADLDHLRSEGKLSEAEERELARKMSRMAEDLQRRLQPQIERMSREIARQVERSVDKSGEMQRLAAELSKHSADFKPDPQAVARLSEMAKSLAADGKVSAEEAERLGVEAKKIAESVKLHEPELREMRELARKHGEMARQAMEEHRDEIEAARREMKQAIEMEMQGVRKELERTRTELRQRMKEEHRERSKVERDGQKERAERPERKERPEPQEREEVKEIPATPPPVR